MAGLIQKTTEWLGWGAAAGYVEGISEDDRRLPDKIFDAELASIEQSRPKRGVPVRAGEGQALRDELVGLALSGGGIPRRPCFRSA